VSWKLPDFDVFYSAFENAEQKRKTRPTLRYNIFMIDIADNLKTGDLVFAWFSATKEKNKKPSENEYRIGGIEKNYLKLESISGNYSMIFGKELIETWFGNVRKSKK
jgi:hypothetical protein